MLYTTISPCMMCSDMVIQFKVPANVYREAENCPANFEFLRENGVEAVLAAQPSLSVNSDTSHAGVFYGQEVHIPLKSSRLIEV